MTRTIIDVFNAFFETVHPDDAKTNAMYRTVQSGKDLTVIQKYQMIQLLQDRAMDWYAAGFDFSSELANPTWPESVNDAVTLSFNGTDFVFTSSKNIILQMVHTISTPAAEVSDNQCVIPASQASIVVAAKQIFNASFDNATTEQALSRAIAILNNQLTYVPHSVIKQDSVSLVNASADALLYWNTYSKNNIEHDLILAKLMGFRLIHPHKQTPYEIIAASDNNQFWGHPAILFNIVELFKIKTVVILDSMSWDLELHHLLEIIKQSGFTFTYNIPTGLSTPMETADVVFLPVSAKFTELEQRVVDISNDFKLAATNCKYPIIKKKFRSIFDSASMSFYIGQSRPLTQGNKQIVSLQSNN